MNKMFKRTGCYTTDAYRALKLAGVIYGQYEIFLQDSKNKIISIVDVSGARTASRILGIIVRAFDNETLIMKHSNEESDPLDVLMNALKYLIDKIENIRKLKHDTKFWVVPHHERLADYLSSTSSVWVNIYESRDLNDVLENGWFTLDLLNKAFSDILNRSTVERIDDPFILERKKILIAALEESYMSIFRDFMDEIYRLSEKYDKIETLIGTNFIPAILKDERILNYTIEGENEKIVNFTKICASDQYNMWKHEDYVEELCEYVRKLLQSGMFKAYRDVILDMIDISPKFPSIYTVIHYMNKFKDNAISYLC